MAYFGMDAATGKAITSEYEHVKKSIEDILTTPVGSRVMRRDYGSRLFYLLGQPMDEFLKARIQVAVSESLARYESRVRFSRIIVNDSEHEQGKIDLTLEGYWIMSQDFFRLDNMVLDM
ncbi:MAG: GPW/gp25 family protein [Gammaproteobacteria bacterium]|nr:GPW/gp25 family protein [Gammaproteobacteria bacterium]NNJ83629.1 hypothetical protein [Gammaproteobacteria bacterium]